MARNAEGKKKKTATKTPHSGKQGMPLRFGLVLFTVLVSAVGLFTSAIGIQQTMYDVALSRVDGELQGALDSWVKNDELQFRAISTTHPALGLFCDALLP